MRKTDEFIKGRVLWKAGKYNLPNESSFFYEHLPESIKRLLIKHLDKDTSGVPVLFFTKPTLKWTLVCTRQVICNNKNTVFRINFEDIRSFKPTVFANAARGGITWWKCPSEV
jgi:hypothetical protein